MEINISLMFYAQRGSGILDVLQDGHILPK
jgi:hypothetical protein